MTGTGNVSSTSNTQNVNTIETNSKANQPTKEYSYGFRACLKSIGRYLTCGFSSSKRRQVTIKEFANTSIPDISKLKNRSAEVKTVLLSSDTLSIQKKLIIYNEYKTEIDTYIQKHKLEHPIGKKINEELTSNNLSNQQKLELYAQNRTAIDSYCQTAGIKNPLLGNSSFNDLEKITAQGIYTANFPTAENIETFMNALDAYVNKEFSAIDPSNNLDEKKTKVQKLETDLKQMVKILNQLGLHNEYSKFKNLSHLPIEKQHEKILESFFNQVVFMQTILRIAMPMTEWLNVVNKTNMNDKTITKAWDEIKQLLNLSDQKFIFNHIKTLDTFKDTCDKMPLGNIQVFSAKFFRDELNTK